MQQRTDTHSTEKAQLFRARLAVAAETEGSVKLAEASVKELTGGDRLSARRLYENPWHFNPTHSLWLQTNHLPEIAGTDEGIWRRVRVMRWPEHFDGDREHSKNNFPMSCLASSTGSFMGPSLGKRTASRNPSPSSTHRTIIDATKTNYPDSSTQWATDLVDICSAHPNNSWPTGLAGPKPNSDEDEQAKN